MSYRKGNHGFQKPQDHKTYQNAWENTRFQTRTIQHEILKYKRLNFGMLECSAFVFLESSKYVTPYPRELKRGSPLGLNVALAHRLHDMFCELAG